MKFGICGSILIGGIACAGYLGPYLNSNPIPPNLSSSRVLYCFMGRGNSTLPTSLTRASLGIAPPVCASSTFGLFFYISIFLLATQLSTWTFGNPGLLISCCLAGFFQDFSSSSSSEMQSMGSISSACFSI